MNKYQFDILHTKLLNNNSQIIHQIWFNLSINEKISKEKLKKYSKFIKSWKKNKGKNWLYHLWTEEECLSLIKFYHPEYLSLYTNYPYKIQQIDSIRYFILYTYGGLYCDIDTLILKPLSSIINNYPKDLYLLESTNKFFDIKTTNCLMYSKRKHIFWKNVFLELYKCKDQPFFYSKHLVIMNSSGPLFLNNVFRKYKYNLKLNVYPEDKFNPIGLTGKNINEFKKDGKYYTIHKGTGSWESNDSKVLIFIYREYIFILLISILFLNFFIK